MTKKLGRIAVEVPTNTDESEAEARALDNARKEYGGGVSIKLYKGHVIGSYVEPDGTERDLTAEGLEQFSYDVYGE